MEFQSEIVLWNAFQQGSREALDELFRSHYPALYRYGFKISGDAHITEESLQDFFVYLYEHRSNLRKPRSVRAYLITAYRRKILTLIESERKRHRMHSLAAIEQADIEFSIDELIISQEAQQDASQQVLSLLNGLPKRQREALYLRYYEELPIKDIAEILSITYQGVVNTLYKGLKSLRGSVSLKKVLSIGQILYWCITV